MTSIPTRKIEMSTEQKQDIHCGTCTVKGDMGACLATPCSVRSSWFANSQAAEIERLTGCLEKANIQAEKFEREWYLRGDEIETLKADAERYRWLKDNRSYAYAMQPDSPAECGIEFQWQQCSYEERNWNIDSAIDDEISRAAIDAMKGTT